MIEIPCSRFATARLERSAFSLIELLAVMAIIAVLMAFLIPAIRGVSEGINLTGASEEISAAVSLAHQRASTFNRQVAIRFYQDESGEGFKSYQIWDKPSSSSDPTVDASWNAVDSEHYLPTGVAVKADARFSALLDIFKNLNQTKPRGAVKYSEVLFTPAGALVAPSDKAFFTLVPESDPRTDGLVSGLPPNFAVVLIEPLNARPSVFRP